MHTEARFIRLPEVCRRTGGSKATVYRWERDDPTFPKKVKLGERLSAWRDEEVSAWIESRTAKARGVK